MGDQQYGGAEPSIPVMSRLDRLDSMMRYLERRQSSSKWGSSSSNWSQRTENLQSMKPLDTAVKEIQSKGSLLDRVASLEKRLFKLCLEVEGSSPSSSSMVHAYENASLSHASSSNQSSSSTSLEDHLNIGYDVHHSSLHRALAERFNFLGSAMDNNSSTQLKHLLMRSANGEEASKSGKKMKARSSRGWKRMLGC